MKKIFAFVMVAGLLLMPIEINAQTEETAAKPPPVGQVLIPEGDFALSLATALNLGTPSSEAEAESMLTSVGIAPQNGWIADYPMTPVVIGQLQDTVVAAAGAERLPLGQDEAIKAFQGVATEFGLFVAQGTGEYRESQPPSRSEYVPPSAVEDYYYNEGPPVVTYYPPPWDYNYLYAWVPYPFWDSGFFFPGFFILNDFDVTVVSHDRHRHHEITNHFIDPKTRRLHHVDPRRNGIGTIAEGSSSRPRRFSSPEVRRGATSIFERNHQTQRQVQPGNVSHGTDNRGIGQSNRAERRSDMGQVRTFSPPQTPGRENSRSFAPGPKNPGSTSFGRLPDGSRGSFAGPNRSFSVPGPSPGQVHGGSIGHSFSGGSSRSSGLSSGGGLSHSGGFGHGGGCRGRC